MSTIKQIKTKIKSTKNLQKITKALEVVSTIKLQKNKSKSEGLKGYMSSLVQIISDIASKIDIFAQDIQTNTNYSISKKLVIVISTEKGLCGAINSKLFKDIYARYTDVDTTDFFVIGKKGFEHLSRIGANIVGYINLKDDYSQGDLLDLMTFFDNMSQEYTSVDISFNYFNNILTQYPISFQLYPVDTSAYITYLQNIGLGFSHNEVLSNHDLVVEPDISSLRAEFFRQIRNFIIVSAISMNKSGEFASRMISMKAAKDNCNVFIKSLTLKANKLRQGAITKEISEIVSAKVAIGA